MPGRKSIAAAGLLALGIALGAGYDSLRSQAPGLTTQDYIDIEQLYIAYTNAIDFGDPEGLDYAGVFTPDGVFALVMRQADGASSPPPVPGGRAVGARRSGSHPRQHARPGRVAGLHHDSRRGGPSGQHGVRIPRGPGLHPAARVHQPAHHADAGRRARLPSTSPSST